MGSLTNDSVPANSQLFKAFSKKIIGEPIGEHSMQQN